jgi:hypothetical protein
MEGNGRRRLGAAGVLGAVTVFGYVLLKEWLLPTYGGPPPFTDSHGLAFHMLETVPLVLIAAGTYGVWAWLRRSGRTHASVGALVASGGAGLAAIAHLIEHVLFQLFHSSLGYVFMAGFYLGWGLVALGLTAVGVWAGDRILVGAHDRALLALVVPLGVVVALLLGTLWFRSFTDGFKLPVGVAVGVLGYRLRQFRGGGEATSTAVSSDASP